MLRRKTNEAWTDKHRHVTRKLVKEVGCRKECPPLVGQTKRSLGDATKKKARRSTDITARVGRKSGTGFQKTWRNRSKGPLEVAARNHVTPSVHWPKSEGCRPEDLDLGGVAQSSPGRHTGGGRARQRASIQVREATYLALRGICH